MVKSIGRLRDSKYICVEEKVAVFLHILGQNLKNRKLRNDFFAFPKYD